jgi:hypothetical protein
MARRGDPGVRRLLAQAGLGALLGWAVLAGLLVTDAAGLARLIAGSDLGAVAMALLALQFAAGFATFSVATAMAMPSADRPRGRIASPQLRPAAPPIRRRHWRRPARWSMFGLTASIEKLVILARRIH